MGYNKPDPYYQPEAFGLKIVAEVSSSADEYDYGFYITVVLHNPETDKYYIMSDSGCSCPSPFEYHDESDLEPVKNLAEVRTRIEHGYTPQEKVDFITALSRAGMPMF